jgi:uncharacterized Fe-S cluster-containing protein
MNWNDAFIFLLGFFTCALFISAISFSNLEIPFGTGFIVSNYLEESPSNWLEEEDILIFDDKVVLELKEATLSSYTDSGSMSPTLDKNTNGIRIVPKSEKDIEVGDIISYRFGGILIVHRVIKKATDEEGTYFLVKGDNNLIGDGKIRFKDIEYVTVAIIY